MKPKMKYSTSKTSSAKRNRKGDKALTKSCKLRKSQKNVEEICHKYYMKLRSGLTIEKKACYFRKEITKTCTIKTGEKHTRKYKVLAACAQPTLNRSFFKAHVRQESTSALSTPSIGGIPLIEESCASLSTYNDQSISFVQEDGSYVIIVEDLGEDQEKDKVRLRYYESQLPSKESGDEVDGKLLMVNMSPTKDKDVWLHANKKEHSVELQKCESTLPEQAFFVLHRESSEFVSFECKSNRGTYIGVKDNQLALVEEKNRSSENIMFRLSQT
ncbi:interleukin-33 [Octodon degus]|uniref:Interleukin-33 n=1 Tax=Octodon degus TaxID=10160 RepID=A0A6P3F278_OCTDE|nr:interleukin-33 [Octodon degus]XP_023577727.1 interleukin-33 [Octodon degus]XP_023577728.1 interleukin-33 [Octodon degus]XP_023577729.1 interleukin-33 [Octodon degus]XP_023577730.1 interleukin-33 [Octodon degus]XP_023577731.1 interleukin-33 [Octodon degus]XP_023577732.1 interleukin-33 [Octodon degus]